MGAALGVETLAESVSQRAVIDRTSNLQLPISISSRPTHLLTFVHPAIEQKVRRAFLDTTIRLFDPDIQPKQIRPKLPRVRNVWFRPGECLRLIYDQLRDATQPITTRKRRR